MRWTEWFTMGESVSHLLTENSRALVQTYAQDNRGVPYPALELSKEAAGEIIKALRTQIRLRQDAESITEVDDGTSERNDGLSGG